MNCAHRAPSRPPHPRGHGVFAPLLHSRTPALHTFASPSSSEPAAALGSAKPPRRVNLRRAGRQTRALSAMPSAQSRWDVFRSERHAERSEPLGRVTLVLDRRASAAAPPAAHAAPAALAAALTGLLAIVVRRRRRRRWIAHDGARAAAGWWRPRRRLQRRRGGGGGGGRRGGRRGGRAEVGADCSHGGWQRGSIPCPLVLAALALPFSTLPSREEGSGARCLSGGRDHY
jgi:hypothetical protein